MALILVVDDEERYRTMLTIFLRSDGHRVLTATQGREALELLDRHPSIELVLLDALMPVLDGWETCRRIKEQYEVPVIMLTALSDEDHEVRGLKNGADDYIGKPFPSRVLLARVQAAVRKNTPGTKAPPICWQSVTVYPLERRVTVQGLDVDLTPREFELLRFLIEEPQQVHSREQLLNGAWGQAFEGGTRTVDTHIKSLRQKLGPAGGLLVTFRRVGYALQATL